MELGWESLSSRRRKHKLVMFYKMINGLCPDNLAEMVPERVSHISSYNLRNSDDYLRNIGNTDMIPKQRCDQVHAGSKHHLPVIMPPPSPPPLAPPYLYIS